MRQVIPRVGEGGAKWKEESLKACSHETILVHQLKLNENGVRTLELNGLTKIEVLTQLSLSYLPMKENLF